MTITAILALIAGGYLAGIPIAWLLIPGDGNVIDAKGRLVYAVTWPYTGPVFVAMWVEKKIQDRGIPTEVRS